MCALCALYALCAFLAENSPTTVHELPPPKVQMTSDQNQLMKDEGSWPNDSLPESNKSSRPAEWDDYFNQSPHYVELIGYGLEYN